MNTLLNPPGDLFRPLRIGCRKVREMAPRLKVPGRLAMHGGATIPWSHGSPKGFAVAYKPLGVGQRFTGHRSEAKVTETPVMKKSDLQK